MKNINIKRILNILNPKPRIGGLEINSSDLRFIFIKDNNFISASIKLPVGIIEEGQIKDKDNLKIVLLKLHSQISSKTKEKIYTVLSIPDNNIYIQIFSLPAMNISNFEEAVKLNLQMVSPVNFSEVYADWQKVGETENNDGQIEILGAFVKRQIVDEYIQCLKETNFIVAGIEFPGLAISRLISGLKNINDPNILLRLDSAGLNFSIIKNYNLYFNHFVSWPTGKRQISLTVFQDLIIQETQRILNFSSKYLPRAKFNNILLIASALEDKVSQIITGNFPLSVIKLNLEPKMTNPNNQWSITNNQLPTISSNWFCALGSALRGLIPRAEDTIISLSVIGTEEEFRQEQIINFIRNWRNIILASLSFVLIIFIIVYVFLIKTADSLNKRLINFASEHNQQAFISLREEANNFNNRINLALQAKNQVFDWSPFLKKIENLTSNEIIIDRIFIQSLDAPILLNGRTIDKKTIIDFKKKIESDPEFKEVDLPLSNIASAPDNSFKFSISFKYVLINEK